ncbi:MAG: DUF1015 domain-containing protein [Calditrichaeota bacterium]|nr:DUF1015 domain-containing protein [Calditrichota bacterium]
MTREDAIVRPFPVTYPSPQYANQFMFFAWDIFLNTDRWEKRKASPGPTIAKIIQADSAREAANEFQRYKTLPDLLRQENRPQFLFAQNHFPDKGGFSRDEVVVLLDLNRFVSPDETYQPGFHRIFPSEETFEKKAINRKKLREAILADVGQVMMVYSDPENFLNQLFKKNLSSAHSLIRNCTYYPGYRYDLFGFSEPKLLATIQDYFRDKIFTVGDGNHRTRAAKMTARELPHIPSARWLMAALVNLYDPDFRIDPIHRLIRHRSDDFLESFFDRMTVTAFDSFHTLWEAFQSNENLYAIAATEGSKFYLLEPKPAFLDSIKKTTSTPVPVHVLNRLLRSHEITREHPDLDTEIEPEDAWRSARDENGTVAFFLKPIPRPVLEEAFSHHLIFPEKAFSIVGKVPAGGPMWLFGDQPEI